MEVNTMKPFKNSNTKGNRCVGYLRLPNHLRFSIGASLVTSRITSLLVPLALLLAASQAQSSACCGGGSSLPSLITGDDKAQVTTSLSSSNVNVDVQADGYWDAHADRDLTRTFKIEAARIFNDRYQSGFSLPIQSREKSGAEQQSSSGLGDLSAQVGYEYLPDWDYSPWRPKGIGFISLVFPSGKSIYEVDSPTGVESHGRGFWTIGAGTVLTKSWESWDANSVFEVHRSLNRQVSNRVLNGTLSPGNGASFAISTGYNLSALRIGAGVTYSYEDPVVITGDNPSQGNLQRFATGVLSVSYLFKDSWSGTVSLSDQTMFGEPTNAALSRGLALMLQKRWQR